MANRNVTRDYSARGNDPSTEYLGGMTDQMGDAWTAPGTYGHAARTAPWSQGTAQGGTQPAQVEMGGWVPFANFLYAQQTSDQQRQGMADARQGVPSSSQEDVPTDDPVNVASDPNGLRGRGPQPVEPAAEKRRKLDSYLYGA